MTIVRPSYLKKYMLKFLEAQNHAGGEVDSWLLEVGSAVVVDACVVLPVANPCEDAVFVVEQVADN